jgi:thiamine biosynthesis lipoprotein
MRELAFASMGTEVRLLGADPARLEPARAEVERLAAILTRFDPASELCALNADPRHTVPASPELRAAVRAALDGARLTGGLADPTVETLEQQPWALSYANSAHRRAHPWREVLVGPRTITRPPGVRLDLGGSAKGWIADRVATMLGDPCAVDCGGDIRVRGIHDVGVARPTGGITATFTLRGGAIATSGIDRRGHHLIDPATGLRARTAALTATALAPTAAEAEARAKAALLGAPGLLTPYGGALIYPDGRVETHGPGGAGHSEGAASAGDRSAANRVAA